jgi:hypothetical protein
MREEGRTSGAGVFDGGAEVVGLDGFEKVFFEAGLGAAFDVLGHAVTGDGEATDGAGGADFGKEIAAVAIGEADIGDKDMDGMG